MRGLFLLSVFVVLSLGCSSNIKELFEQGVANGTDPTQIMCTDGVWTIPGDVILNSGKLYVNNDTLNIGGSLKFGSAASFFLQFYTNSSLGTSGMINIGVTVDWGKALCEAEILYPAGLGPFKYVFASFPKGQPPTVFKFGEFVIPHEQRFCRKQSEGTTISFPGGDSAALSSSLSGSADGCDTSKDRTWVLAILIIAGIWAVALLVFTLVTCKLSENLKTKFWESDYARA